MHKMWGNIQHDKQLGQTLPGLVCRKQMSPWCGSTPVLLTGSFFSASCNQEGLVPCPGFGVFCSPFALPALFPPPAVLAPCAQPPHSAFPGAPSSCLVLFFFFFFISLPCPLFLLIFHQFHFPLLLPLFPSHLSASPLPFAPVHNHYHHNHLERA